MKKETKETKKPFLTIVLVLAVVAAAAAGFYFLHPHSFGDAETIKEATCTEDGLKERSCFCGEKLTTTVAAKGHTFAEWVVDEEATCMETGTKHRVCTVCGEKEAETIPVNSTAHNFSTDWTSDDEKHWHVCQNEGCTSVSDETAHTFGEWVIDVVDSCMQAGVRHHVCEVCGKSVSENYADLSAHNYSTNWTSNNTHHWHECQNDGCASIPDKSLHTFGEWIVDTAATCQNTGTRHHVCTVCNKSVSESYSDANAHNYATTWTSDDTRHWHKCQNSGCTSVSGKTTHTFGEWIVDTAATCQKTGTRHHICTVCNKSVSESYSDPDAHKYATAWTSDNTDHWHKCQNSGCTSVSGKTTHTFGEWIVDAAATCQKTGTRHHVCTVCNKSVSESYSDPDAHNYASAWTSDNTDHWHKCQNSGCTSVSGKTTHTFGEWIVDTAATCQKSGTRHHVCTVCNKSVSESYSDPTAHTESEWIVDKQPTLDEEGLQHTECTLCGERMQEGTIPVRDYSSGLAYSVNEDSATCTITGIGTCKDTDVFIPPAIDGYTVTSIGDEAFLFCEHLTSITIPEGVTSIGAYAFNNCNSLTSITISDSVTRIGSWAFFNNGYYKDTSNWENGILYIGKHLIDAETSLSGSYAIKEGTICIADQAFYICNSLTSITISDSVTRIGTWAFYGCSGLTSITIPSSVTSIGDGAFYNCSGLTSITIPSSVTTISSAFYNCTGLKTVAFAEGSQLKSIGSSAFYNCSGLTSITIPSSVTTIGSSAFYNCTSLTSITIPDSVTSIGAKAFDNCTSLTSITFGENSQLKSIGSSAFYNGSGLTSITIPSSVTTIDSSAFYNCTGLKTVAFAEGSQLKSVGSSAFYNCSGLASITIPSGVTSIGEMVFYNCQRLTSITIPSSVTRIGAAPFAWCSRLTSITVDADNSAYMSTDGNLYTKNGKTLVQYAMGKTATSFEIPSSVTSIGNYAFAVCTRLKSITIPDSVTSIGEKAFDNCTRLTSITFGENSQLKSIGKYAFKGCISLTFIAIPSSMTSIGEETFRDAVSLMLITIPSSVTSIGKYAFFDCCDLMRITFGGTKAQWNKISKGSYWNYDTPTITVTCTDGTITV